MLSDILSPAESEIEDGRRPVVLHTSPKADINFLFFELRVGYVFLGRMG